MRMPDENSSPASEFKNSPHWIVIPTELVQQEKIQTHWCVWARNPIKGMRVGNTEELYSYINWLVQEEIRVGHQHPPAIVTSTVLWVDTRHRDSDRGSSACSGGCSAPWHITTGEALNSRRLPELSQHPCGAGIPAWSSRKGRLGALQSYSDSDSVTRDKGQHASLVDHLLFPSSVRNDSTLSV